MSNRESLTEATEFIRTSAGNVDCDVGIVLGTGLGQLTSEMAIEASIPFSEIPHFSKPTVQSHVGSLIIGKWAGRRVACLKGRLHYYEGFSMAQITFPIRVMHALGSNTLIVTNASGGLNPDFQVGDLMTITDHIGLFLTDSALRGPRLGPSEDRFPDMVDAYDLRLRESAHKIANALGISLKQGIYAAVPGPQLETRAEYTLLRALGADAVGMSTVPEVIVARQLGLRCFGLSVITDLALPGKMGQSNFKDFLSAAKEAEPKARALIGSLLGKMV